jgi:DNA-binding transcriptional ArsR family regulator
VLKLSARHDALHRVGKALADPNRCNLLVSLLDGPAYSSDLADRTGLSRSNTSNHLTCLRGCGLVVATAEGRQIRYQIADEHLAHAIRDLLDVVLAVDCDD